MKVFELVVETSLAFKLAVTHHEIVLHQINQISCLGESTLNKQPKSINDEKQSCMPLWADCQLQAHGKHGIELQSTTRQYSSHLNECFYDMGHPLDL